ncbi:hypothetical protein MMC28_003536 [Mycoblastus sanguinarius]|nr:hypothetical protein [Mycoblastus sanguinarius]
MADNPIDWRRYPLQMTTAASLGSDLEDCYNRLLADSPRLFSSQHKKLEYWFLPQNLSKQGQLYLFSALVCYSCPHPTVLQLFRETTCQRVYIPAALCARPVENDHDVADLLQVGHGLATLPKFEMSDQESHEHSFFIFRQKDSWSEFLTTREIFQQILASQSVFPPFLDFVHAFGFKISDLEHENQSIECYRRHIVHRSDSLEGVELYELCYNLQFFELNGRSVNTPWSLRQTGVYQKVNFQTKTTVWILLQPSKRAEKRLKDAFGSRTSQTPLTEMNSPMKLHQPFLHVAVSGWNEYVAYLRKDVNALDEKACFSRVGQEHKCDFEVTFADSQKLQLVRRRLLRASSVLDSSLEVLCGCILHCRELELQGIESAKMCDQIASYTAQLEGHKRKIEVLLVQSSGTTHLLLKILEYRNNEVIHANSETLRSNVRLIGLIAGDTKKENENMSRLTEQGRKDSISVRALTLVATFYLPGTFLATIFSSNLIQVQTRADPVQATHFVIAGEFWVYSVITVALMALTVGLTVGLEKRWSKNKASEQA